MMQPLKSPSVYQDLHIDLEHQDETHRDADASASPLMGSVNGEKAWSDITAGDHHHHQEAHGAEKSPRRGKICAVVMSVRSVLDTILLLVILVLLVERRQWYGKPGSAEKSSSDIAGDITGFAPPSMFCFPRDTQSSFV